MRGSIFARVARQPADGLTRREFLATTIAAGLALFLPERAQARSRARVTIVGGGFAGLACAYELGRAGFAPLILEAGSRVGGRVFSVRNFVAPHWVEGGAELIGSNHPVWQAYAQRFGLRMMDVTEPEELDYPIVLDGRRLSSAQAAEVWSEIDEVLNRFNRLAAPIDAELPWQTPGAADYDRISLADWLANQKDISELCRNAVRAQLEGDNARPLRRQSYLGMLTQVKGGGLDRYWTESEVYRCANGNDRLAAALARQLGDERIRLKIPVNRIAVSETGCLVETEGGERFETDFVVLAVPPTQWRNLVLEPRPGFYRRRSLGPARKLLSAVEGRFWLKQNEAAWSLHNGRVSWTWDGTDNQRIEHLAVLTAFAGGPAAASGGAPREIIEGMQQAIERAYPEYRSKLRQTQLWNWPAIARIGGGYSFPLPREITTIGPQVYAGVKNRLFFAGEHTCYAFVGYMEGALQSGVRVARQIGRQAGVIGNQ
jgi:monoamine oxidase